MMHSFFKGADLFSLPMEDTVDTCRAIFDDLLVFDITGRIIAARTGDSMLGTQDNFLSLLGADESFFRQNCLCTVKKPLILLTEKGATAIFRHLFSSFGLFVAVVFHADIGAVKAFFETYFVGDVIFSEQLVKAESLAEEQMNDISDTVRYAMDAIGFPGEETMRLFDVLPMRVCAIARFVGCHVHCRVMPFTGRSELFVFHMPAFAAVLLCLFMEARKEATDRGASVVIYEQDGRVFIRFEMQCTLGNETMISHCRDYCAKKEFPFIFSCENGKETIEFSPEVCDVALLGLKNRIVFE